ncbi:hypothetical protein [Bradyrhizobium sp. CCGUVB23]|uniref:hypothetical protein n=1 Tax=Bradyrhizobium sp. CCGUVB23 TaxID=2949630 RepID=UPI0020B3A39A|nr:hypothetical protein [Bradyrhizobium sp. CCGUVB23]MCP3460378.1 hypothetical protein [Bradyrhizobium sp. CCGUVB23]
MWENGHQTLPLVPHGSQIAARRSTIKATLWSRERAAFAEENQETLVRLHILLAQILLLTTRGTDFAAAVRSDQQVRALTMEALRTMVRLIQ